MAFVSGVSVSANKLSNITALSRVGNFGSDIVHSPDPAIARLHREHFGNLVGAGEPHDVTYHPYRLFRG